MYTHIQSLYTNVHRRLIHNNCKLEVTQTSTIRRMHKSIVVYFICLFAFKDFVYLFLERGREEEREGKKHWCVRYTSIGCPLHTPNPRPGPQPRHVPWPVVKLATSRFTGQGSILWATPAKGWLWCIYKMEHQSAIKRHIVLINMKTETNP